MCRKRRPTTILIDASDIDRPSGGRTAVLDLFRVLFAQRTDWHFIALVSRHESAFDFPHVQQRIVPFRNRLMERLWIQFIVLFLSVTGQVDLVHFARTLGGISWPAKSVLTVFDITTLKFPHLHSRHAVWFWRNIQPLLILNADRIIAISQDVKHDLESFLSVSPEKIDVVYCAPKSVFHCHCENYRPRALRDKYHLPERYMLFVGMIAKKKNLSTLIEALHRLKIRREHYLPLVIVGRRYKQSDDVAIFDQIRSLGLKNDIYYLGPVPDQDLPGLYRGADIFVFPSLHEGFGIPCVEAMACRVPVIASRSGAIPEVVDDAALLVSNPKDPQSFADAILRLMENSDLRRDLINRGIKRAEYFVWSRFAQQVLGIYECVLGEM
ncbi:MAG: glycosyltransferase family 4 protein [Anaerolineae bacterium]